MVKSALDSLLTRDTSKRSLTEGLLMGDPFLRRLSFILLRKRSYLLEELSSVSLIRII